MHNMAFHIQVLNLCSIIVFKITTQYGCLCMYKGTWCIYTAAETEESNCL